MIQRSGFASLASVGRLSLGLFAGLVLAVASPSLVLGQAYPERPILMVVPFPPGGADIVARIIATRLSQRLGQAVIVENRPGGAGGTVGTKSVAAASPDGYTITFASPGQITVAPAVNKQLGYDPVRDFEPVTLIAASPFALAANPSLNVASIQDLVTLAKARPGKINYASPGVGTTSQLLGEMLKQLSGIDIVHVPYKGSAPAITDLISGQVDIYFDNLRNLQSYAQSGKLKLLAVTSAARAREMPDVPTMKEAGLPQLTATYWNGVFTPAKTPSQIIERLNNEINAVLQEPATVDRIRALGMEPEGGSSEAFRALVQSELAKWKQVAATRQ